MKQQKIFIKRFVKSPKVDFVKVNGQVVTSSKVVFEGDKYEPLAKKGKLLEMEPRIAYIDIPENDSDILAVLKTIEADGEEAAIKKYGEKVVDEAFAFAEAEEEKEREAAEAAAKLKAEQEKLAKEIKNFIDSDGQEAAIAKYGADQVAAATKPEEDDQSGTTDPATDSSIPPAPNPINPPPSGHEKKKEGEGDGKGEGEGGKKEKKRGLVARFLGRKKNKGGKKK